MFMANVTKLEEIQRKSLNTPISTFIPQKSLIKNALNMTIKHVYFNYFEIFESLNNCLNMYFYTFN